MSRGPFSARAALAAALLLASSASAEAAIILLPSLGTQSEVTICGRVLKDAPRGSTRLSRNLRRLLVSNWEGAPLEIAALGQKAIATSGHDGEFEVTLSAPKDRPFKPGVHVVEARVRGAGARSFVEVVSDRAPFFVISDFDDTLAVSNVTDSAKLAEAALLEDSDSQPVVKGMAAFYRCLKEGKAGPPSFALVSGSPVQYGPRVGAFLQKHGFPQFGLYLRNLGPSTLSGYKQPIIRRLLERLPHKVVLVGDSGEKDPEVYAEMRAAFPDRVLRIYIRDVGKSEDSKRFEGMVLFKDPKAAAEDALAQGLLAKECLEKW
ncbi:MAG: DUF2183 domain-containing protein [Myxococcales bacterium]|nr:DUF2183 domain-containing protein [Myxococcales bacterium]